MLLYADDLVILAYSPVDLKRKLRILEQYCDKNGLSVNTRKTQIMVFRAGGKRGKDSQHLFYKGERVEIVNRYTYLGVRLSTSSLGVIPANSAVRKAKIAMTKGDSWGSISKLFDNVVASTLLYTSPICRLRYTSVLETAQVDFFKRLFHLPKCTPDCGIRLKLGIDRVDYGVSN